MDTPVSQTFVLLRLEIVIFKFDQRRINSFVIEQVIIVQDYTNPVFTNKVFTLNELSCLSFASSKYPDFHSLEQN